MTTNNLRTEAFKIRGLANSEVSKERKGNLSAKKQLEQSPVLDLEICGDHSLRERRLSRSAIENESLLRKYRKLLKESRQKAMEKMIRDNKEAGDRLLKKRAPTTTFTKEEMSNEQHQSDVNSLRSMSDGSDSGEEMSLRKLDEKALVSLMIDREREAIINNTVCTSYKEWKAKKEQMNRLSSYSDSDHSHAKIPMKRKTLALSKESVDRSSNCDEHDKEEKSIESLNTSVRNDDDKLLKRSSKFYNVVSKTRDKKNSSSVLTPYSQKGQQQRSRFEVAASDSEILDLEDRRDNTRSDFVDERRVVEYKGRIDSETKENEIIAHLVKKLMNILKSRKSSDVTIAVSESLENVESTPIDKPENPTTEGNEQSLSELTIIKELDQKKDSLDETIEEVETFQEDESNQIEENIWNESSQMEKNIEDECGNEQSQSSMETIATEDSLKSVDDEVESVHFDRVVLQKDVKSQTPTLDLRGRVDHLAEDCCSLISMASSDSPVSSSNAERLPNTLSPISQSVSLVVPRLGLGTKRCTGRENLWAPSVAAIPRNSGGPLTSSELSEPGAPAI